MPPSNRETDRETDSKRFRVPLLLAAVLWTAAAAYGSLTPGPIPNLSASQAWSAVVDLDFTDFDVTRRVDWVSNLLLFVPFGLFWFAAASGPNSGPLGRFVAAALVVTAAAAFGISLEVLQLGIPKRLTSAKDVQAQLLGTVVGIAAWLAAGPALPRRVRATFPNPRPPQPFDRFLACYAVGFAFFALRPFDVTIHPVGLAFPSPSTVDATRFAIDALIYVPIGALCATAWTPPASPVRPVSRALALGVLVAAAVEASQLFIVSRVCDATDVAAAALGVFLGAILMRVPFLRPSLVPTAPSHTRRGWAVSTTLAVVTVLALFWRPGGLSAEEQAEIHAEIRNALDDAFIDDGRPTAIRPPGISGTVGCRPDPTRVRRLVITQPGVYENYLVDGEWGSGNLLKVSVGDVVIRNCEVRNGTHNAVAVYADDVLIENCRIHHVLKGTSDKPQDAHGVTGRPRRLVVRNCEIFQVSGDAIQFDPDREAWSDVLIDGCTLWTAPLAEDAGGYRRGDRPGENAVDTKADSKHPRARLSIRNCEFRGWGDGRINNQAALNLKEHIDATVEHCLFRDCDIALRLRGDAGRGNADVTIRGCTVYDCDIGVRTEDAIANLRIDGLGFGDGVARKYLIDRGRVGPGFSLRNEFAAPPIDFVERNGVTPPAGGPELPPPITPRAADRTRRR